MVDCYFMLCAASYRIVRLISLPKEHIIGLKSYETSTTKVNKYIYSVNIHNYLK